MTILWNATWQSALVVLLVRAFCRMFPKLPPALRCSLWRLTLAKFLIAVCFVTPAVLPLLPATPGAEPMPRRLAGAPAAAMPWTAEGPAAMRMRPAAAKIPSSARTLEVLPTSGNPSFSVDDGSGGATMDIRRTNFRLPDSEVPLHEPVTAGILGHGQRLAFLALLLYVLGVSAGAARVIIQGARTARWRRRSCTLVGDANTVTEVEVLARRLGLTRPPLVLIAPDIELPLLVGLVQPAIVTPAADLWKSYTPDQRRLMLGHELAHLRRQDLLWVWLPTVVRVLFFFDPFAYLAQREEDLARETACDALAIQAANVTVADYGALLLTVAARWRRPAVSFAGLGIASDRVTSLRLRLLGLQRQTPQSPFRLRFIYGLIALSLPAVLVPWKVVAAGSAKTLTRSALSAANASEKATKQGSLRDLPPGSGVIEGRVILEPSDTPGRGFCVALWPAGSPNGPFRLPVLPTSDVEGRYRIDHIPAGKYIVAAWKSYDADYLNALVGDGRLSVTVGQGERVSHQDLKFLTKQVTVFGKITDVETGQPVTNLEVGGMSADGDAAGIAQWSFVDHDGRYKVYLPAGHAELVTRYSGGISPAAPFESPYRVARSTTDVRKRIDTQLGQSQRIDLQIRTERASAPAGSLPPMTGQVLDENGRPAAGAGVILNCQSDTGNLLGQTFLRADTNGQFQWEGMRPQWAGATLDIRARDTKDFGLVSQPVRITLPPGGLKSPLTLHLAPNVAANVTGRVVDSAGHGIPDAPVYLAARTLVRDDEIALTDSKGRYQFAHIWPVAQLSIRAEKDGYGRGGVFLDHRHPLTAGERRTMPSLVVERTDKVVAGVLMRPSGDPLSGGRIDAFALWSGRSIGSSTDNQGRFYIENIPAGKVLLFYGGHLAPVSAQAGDTHVQIVFQHPGKRPPYYSY